MSTPPFTASTAPVMYPERSSRRKRTAEATSSGRPSRLTGMRLTIEAGTASGMCPSAAQTLRRYCPPTSKRALVISPREQTRTASIRTAKVFSPASAAALSRSSAAGRSSAWRS